MLRRCLWPVGPLFGRACLSPPLFINWKVDRSSCVCGFCLVANHTSSWCTRRPREFMTQNAPSRSFALKADVRNSTHRHNHCLLTDIPSPNTICRNRSVLNLDPPRHSYLPYCLFCLICRFCKVASLMGDSLFWQPVTLSFFCCSLHYCVCVVLWQIKFSLSLSRPPRK